MIQVYTVYPDKRPPTCIERLYGHMDSVLALCTSREFGVLISSSEDTTAIIWDLNYYTVIRSLGPHEAPVTCVAISQSTGDIATLCCLDDQCMSRIRLWTINGVLVGCVDTLVSINCISMSSFPMGVHDNLIVAGFTDVRNIYIYIYIYIVIYMIYIYIYIYIVLYMIYIYSSLYMIHVCSY